MIFATNTLTTPTFPTHFQFSGASQEILNSSRGAFVLAALCDSCPEVLKKIKVDKDVKKIIKAKIKKGGVVKGYEALLEKL
jgi:hypothetical protein